MHAVTSEDTMVTLLGVPSRIVLRQPALAS
jgi:hypothetical protein